MFDLVAGTQVHYRSNIPGVYDIQGRSSSFVVHSFVLGYEPFIPEEQLIREEGAIFLITNVVTLLGSSAYIN